MRELGFGLSTELDPGSATYSPVALFAGGEAGFYFDPSVLSSLFQERTGGSATTPAVVDGVVGTMLDLSGNGNHATAPSDAARPILKQSGGLYYLQFDGVNDCLVFDGSDLVGTTYTVAAAWEQLTDPTGVNRIVIGGTTAVNNAAMLIGWPAVNTTIRFGHFGNVINYTTAGLWGSSPRNVATGLLTGTGKVLRTNGVQRATDAVSTQLSGFAGAAIGRIQTTFADVAFYGAIGRDTTTTGGDLTDLEMYLARKSGVSF